MKRPNYQKGDVYCGHCGDIIHPHERKLKLKRAKDGFRHRVCGYKVRVTAQFRLTNPSNFDGPIHVTRGYGKTG